MFAPMIFLIITLANGYDYSDITTDTLEATVNIVNSQTFNNVRCTTLILRETTQLLSLSGISDLQIVELPSTLTTISTSGLGQIQDVEFRMPTNSTKVKVQDDMLLYSPDGTFNPIISSSNYVIKYFGKNERVKINFSCTIVAYAFYNSKFYVTRLELGDTLTSRSSITMETQGIKFPSILFYHYDLFTGSPQYEQVIYSTASYFPASRTLGPVLFFNPYESINSTYQVANLTYIQANFKSIQTLGFSDGIRSIIGSFSQFPYLTKVIFEGKTDIVLTPGVFAFSAITTVNFSYSHYKFDQPILSQVGRAVQVIPPLHSNVFPSRIYEQAMTPATLETREDIDTIGERCFYGCLFTTITLPRTIVKFERLAFARCQNLKYINMETITSIDMYCFSYCYGLQTFTFPNKIKIGKSVFYFCKNLASIYFKSPEIEFGDAMCEKCNALTTVEFAEGTKSLSREMFSQCQSLVTLNLPDSITELRNRCLHLIPIQTFRIPNSVESIGFIGVLPRLQKIYIDSSSKLSEVRDLFGWRNCQDKPELSFPSITTIDLTNNGNFVIDSNFLYTKDFKTMVVSLPGNNLNSTNFRPTTTSVNTFAFFNNKHLGNLVFPSNCKAKIATYAFYNMPGLKVVSLPKYVSVSKDTFVLTKNITSFCFRNNNENYKATVNISGAPLESIGNGCEPIEEEEIPEKFETIQQMEKSVDPFKLALAAVYYV